MKGKTNGKSREGVRKTCEKNAMKVVYISTPMKVKTSASKFREIVQELTGRESDVVKMMENFDNNNNDNDNWMVPKYYHNKSNEYNNYGDYYDSQKSIVTRNEFMVPIDTILLDDKNSGFSSSEEVVELFDGIYMSDIEQQSSGQFDHSNNLLYASMYDQIDALGSY